jgi:uncharacterized protein YuzE
VSAVNDETKVGTLNQLKINKAIAYTMLAAGLSSTAASPFVSSYVLAFIGLALTFWGALLLYVTPTKHVPLELFNAAATANLPNIEKILINSNTKAKGIYLPPKYLKDFESSLIFIPSTPNQPLPTPEEINEQKLYSENPKGILLTPPGLQLSKLFEKKLETSFTRTDLRYIQEKLPKLLIEDLEIADDAEIKTTNHTITIEITNHIFNQICEETNKLQRTSESIGSPLSSAIACALAKATGKPITIEKEEQNTDRKTTRIQIRTLEE